MPGFKLGAVIGGIQVTLSKVEMLRREAAGRRVVLSDAHPPSDCRILYTTYYESINGRSPFFGYYFFNGLLMIIQVLHVYWSYLILRMLYNFTWKGKVGRAMAGSGALQHHH